MNKLIWLVAMLLASFSVYGQPFQGGCQSGLCSGYGPPPTAANSCTVGSVYTDVSTPNPTVYGCKAGFWSISAGASPLPVPVAITRGLAAEYLFPASNPMLDVSGNGNNGILPGGVNNPTATAQGLQFGASTPQYFSLPINTGVTYVATLCMTLANAANTSKTSPNPISNGYQITTLAESSSSAGIQLNLFGNNAFTTPGAWTPGMGGANTNPALYKLTTSPNLVGGCHVFTWIAGTNPTLDRMFIDNNEVSYSTQGSSGAFVGQGTIFIGGAPGGALTNANFYGVIKNLFVYTTVLTDDEVGAMVNSLKTTIPTIYPNTSQVNQLVCPGDSITWGQGVTNPFCSATSFTPTETVNITNLGVPGRYMAAIDARAQAEVYPYYSISAGHNTATVFACTNDFALGGRTVAQCYTDTVADAKALRVMGFKVILVAMLSRTSTSPAFDTTFKDPLDLLLNANWSQFADGYISPTDPNGWADGASAGTIGTPATVCPGATTFFQDCIHPVQTFQTTLGTYLTNAYNKLWGSTATAYNITNAATYTLLPADSYLRVTVNSTLTLPSCTGESGTWTIKVNPSITVTIKTASSAQTIDGTDYSVSGKITGTNSTNVFLVVPSSPTTATCTWTQVQ